MSLSHILNPPQHAGSPLVGIKEESSSHTKQEGNHDRGKTQV
ncbi:hypothetical protein Hdeb2414_s0025g00663861 [Helianthus debilis subsp. tardiflorus]